MKCGKDSFAPCRADSGIGRTSLQLTETWRLLTVTGTPHPPAFGGHAFDLAQRSQPGEGPSPTKERGLGLGGVVADIAGRQKTRVRIQEQMASVNWRIERMGGSAQSRNLPYNQQIRAVGVSVFRFQRLSLCRPEAWPASRRQSN